MTVVRRGPPSATTETVVAGLVRAWNSGSAKDFAGFFTEDADLINMHGMHLRGRQAIAGVYELLFVSVFANANVRASVARQTRLCDDLELVHVRVNGHLRQDASAGEQQAMVSLILTQRENGWMVAAMHNTLVTEAYQYTSN